jgi:citrate lyase subunit beta/citryl-CoA lyase
MSGIATEKIAAAQSFLFVPGDRPERFDKAFAAGADFVIVDFEDAVANDRKNAARQAVDHWLTPDRGVLIRISEPANAAELSICARPGVDGIVLPKATAATAAALAPTGKPVIALIETASAVLDLRAIASTPGVVRLAIGALDLALDIGLSSDGPLLDGVRLQMAIASRAAGIAPPINGVTANFSDSVALTDDVQRVRALGFTGKLCIHPLQIVPVRTAFAPTAAEIAWARKVLTASPDGGSGAISMLGEMVDKPVIERARRILQLSRVGTGAQV